MGPRKPLAIYPLLFAIHPVLFLYSRNMDWSSPADLAKPAVLSLALAAVVIALARIAFRDTTRAGVAASVALIAFFSYGHIYDIVEGIRVDGFIVGRTKVLFPLYCATALAAAVLVARTRRRLEPLGEFARALGVLLVAITVVQIVSYQLRPNRRSSEKWDAYVEKCCTGENALPVKENAPRPDIYYIVLDNYSRADVLAEDFGYDNRDFISYLEAKGFYVAVQSNSNCLGTLASLPSSLNFGYPKDLLNEAGIASRDDRCMLDMVSKCRAGQLLKGTGYRFVSFPSGFRVTGNVGADTVIRRSALSLTEFDRVFLNSTMLMAPAALVPKAMLSSVSEVESYRNDMLYTLRRLAEVPGIDEPTFAFAHIMAAHPPFVFDANGGIPNVPFETMTKANQLQSYDPGLYTDSITFLNREMRTVIESILATSEEPPIIILQADHGLSNYIDGRGLPSKPRRHAILNAYYLPGGGDNLLYPSISPVNSFRVVFNHYFGANFEMLPDEMR